jgi:hypothetical protein
MITIKFMLLTILDLNTSLKQAEVIGRNLWRRGLMVQQHCRRVEKDIIDLDIKHKEGTRVMSRRSTHKRYGE